MKFISISHNQLLICFMVVPSAIFTGNVTSSTNTNFGECLANSVALPFKLHITQKVTIFYVK